jgi:pimeloyl-ACP methyl ester carboxylesterase
VGLRHERSAAGAIAIALVHGVGFGPSTFARVQRELRRTGRVVVVERRGYGPRAALAPPARVEDHVDDLLAALDAAGIERAVVAGSSGGATVALAAALTAPGRVVAAVAHEPAVGSLAPELLALIAGTVRSGGGRALVRTLAGPHTWGRLTAAEVAQLDACAELVEADSHAYLGWAPPLGDAGAGAPVTTTVGEHSSPLRHEVARRLEQRAGARIVVLPGCGHLAQLDAPAAFAAVISEVAGRYSPVSVAASTEHPTTCEEPR